MRGFLESTRREFALRGSSGSWKRDKSGGASMDNEKKMDRAIWATKFWESAGREDKEREEINGRTRPSTRLRRTTDAR